MKKAFLLTVLSLVVAVLVVIGSLSNGPPSLPRTSQPDVIMDVLDPSLDIYAAEWQKEIGRRFHNAVGVLAHGGELETGRWICLDGQTPVHLDLVADLAAREQAKYPGRTIVMLCCNPGHIAIHNLPGVYYATSSVWCEPDRDVPMQADTNCLRTLNDPPAFEPIVGNSVVRSDIEPDDVGNIFEFVEAN